MAPTHSPAPQTTSDSTDVFSISDAVLSEKLQFVEEIGSGNWGSVWLCRSKPESREDAALTAQSESSARPGAKLAVKLVHRSKSAPKNDDEKKVADAASKRVKTLWSEMKIVRTLNQEPHPSIITFQSFIITPSFAMIAMPFLPQLIPVEVPELKAKAWLHSLLSGVEFIHRCGVVHNDIKPANVMISSRNIPVLIDFGFAERYNSNEKDAFISNLHYGTPEYIAPERAGGLPHDTRKADVWSLGITFFEILVGRTPFEHGESEKFITTEDLKKYWQRTLQGKWVGSWKMSTGVERMLTCMLNPNADLRSTAAEAMSDRYWYMAPNDDEAIPVMRPPPTTLDLSRARSATQPSRTPSVADIISPWTTRSIRSKHSASRENLVLVASPVKLKEKRTVNSASSSPLASEKRCRSAALTSSSYTGASGLLPPVELNAPSKHAATKKRPTVYEAPVLSADSSSEDLTSLPAPATPRIFIAKREAVKPVAKENKVPKVPRTSSAKTSRKTNVSPPKPVIKPMGPRLRGTPSHDAIKATKSARAAAQAAPPMPKRVLADQTAAAQNAANMRDATESGNTSLHLSNTLDASVVRRMLDWEAERSRMRSMLDSPSSSESGSPVALEKVNVRPRPSPTAPPPPVFDLRVPMPSESPPSILPAKSVLGKRNVSESSEDAPQPEVVGRNSLSIAGDSALNILKQSLKFSAGFAEKAMGHIAKRSTPVLATMDMSPKNELVPEDSWEDEVAREAQVCENVTPEDKEYRMSVWARSVEKAVEDARHNFGQFAVSNVRTSPVVLPLPPKSRRGSRARRPSTKRSARIPRKALAANQIFNDDATPNATIDASGYGADYSANTGGEVSVSLMLPTPKNVSSLAVAFPTSPVPSPVRPRRNTIASRSPKPSSASRSRSRTSTPSKQKDRSKSTGRHLQMPITPVAQLNYELDRSPPRATRPERLSALVDRDAFIANLSANTPKDPRTPGAAVSSDGDLTSSPFLVEPYQPRMIEPSSQLLDTPGRLRTESAYDRFLIASSGVTRVGQGYQSNPSAQTLQPSETRRSSRFFMSSRRVPMHPPISSEDVRRATSVDELGAVLRSTSLNTTPTDDDTNGVWRTFKAVVTGKTASRRVSRAY